ncbi:diacylglycerol kinase 3-like [Andrographis paniculata]|uniref:diacylglycerol kinase 3-like n=1 Tax=Andrographis paniculata TaxID=175694 RepID=UPI0021E88F14|nr:diacylglycerol kinase 3-like [Andrographis paniculata]
MDTPGVQTSSTASGRSSVVGSLRAFTLSGVRVDKEELRKKIMFPEYLRMAMREAIRAKDVGAAAVVQLYEKSRYGGAEAVESAEWPIVVFINSKSGGRHGAKLKSRLQELMGEEQVFDLLVVKPHEFVQYGLTCLENFASFGDNCAKMTREKLRIVVAGGDGTVGWVLGCLEELNKQDRLPIPPTGIIPLGTGNDLSRSFGWGGSFPFNWKSSVKRTLEKIACGSIAQLDSWRVLISMPAGEELEAPYSLKKTEERPLDQEHEVEGEFPEKVACYQGVFYNYFSIGMDARVAYGFHHLRNEKPYLAQGPISNKLIYSGFSCTQGWFFTPCSSDPGLRSLKNILRIYLKRVNCLKWEQVPVPSSVRSIVVLNLPSYGSGRNPWGKLKPDYLEKRGFVDAHADDGLVEIFGLKQGWHASMVMVELISAKHIAQASAIRFELRGGEWKDAFMQMDGEPWKQPMSNDFSTFVEIKRVLNQSAMIRAS